MKSTFTPFILGAVIGVMAALLSVEQGFYLSNFTSYTNPSKSDTIYTNTVYKEIRIEPKHVAVPEVVKVYKTDTLYRERMEQDTLVSTILLNPRKAEVHTITPAGFPLTHHYDIRDFKSMRIDHKGRTEINLVKHPKRRRVMRIIGKLGLFVGGVLIGSSQK